jgi:hypothetical protein
MVSSDEFVTAFAGTLTKPNKLTLNQSFAKEPASRPDKKEIFKNAPPHGEKKNER